jgi:anti-sigma B factor antagonist
MDFGIEERRLSQKRVVLTVTGRVTAVTAASFKSRAKKLVEDGSIELIFDLGGVTFIDSTGLATLVSSFKATREAGGWLRLANLSEPVRIIFKATLLERVFDTFPDVATAST